MAQQWETLSFGVLLVIVALALVTYTLQIITRLDEVIAMIIAFYGAWYLALAGIRTKYPEKYGRGAYNTLVIGVILVALGGAWYLNIATANIILPIVLLLLVIGILAVATAIPSIRQK
jgi:cobalamin synthase